MTNSNGSKYNSPWRLEDRKRLRNFLKRRGLVTELPEGTTPQSKEAPVGVGAIVTLLDNARPKWYRSIPKEARRRLIAYAMHDLGYVGHSRGYGGRISSWVHRQATQREGAAA